MLRICVELILRDYPTPNQLSVLKTAAAAKRHAIRGADITR
jgi:hypothetical protein